MLISFSVQAETVPGDTLLSFFSQNCRQGEWTLSALSDSRSIIQTLTSMAEDPDCRSLGGAIASLNTLNSQLTSLQNINTTQEQISILDAQEQELMFQLTQTSDPLTIESINSSLRATQMSRAGYIGQESSQNNFLGPAKLQLMSGVVQLANVTISQIASNQKCLQKNPSLLNAAAGVMSAVGAAAVFVNPALGFGLTAGSILMGQTLEGIRVGNLNRQIRRLSDRTIAPEAYRCALESMTDRWCQMKDAETMVKFKAEHRRVETGQSDLASAIRLSDREIPRMIDFFERIRSGVTPNSVPDATRLTNAWDKENIVRKIKASGIGFIGDKRDQYEAAVGRDAKWIVLRYIINVLAPGEMGANFESGPNPLYEVKSRGYAPFFLAGVADGTPDIFSQGNYLPITSWQRPSTHELTIDELEANFLAWVKEAEDNVKQELGRVLQPDQELTFAGASEPNNNPWKISFMTSVKNVINFIEHNSPEEPDSPYRNMYISTLASLREISRIIEDSATNRSTAIAESSIEEIYDLAQLRYGTVLIQLRLELIVRVSLLNYIQSSPTEDQTLAAQLLASNRFTETLKRFNGLSSLTEIQRDLNNAKDVTYQNLNSFVEIFGRNINKVLFDLKSEESRSSATGAKNARDKRTQLCFLLLGADKTRFNVNTSYCDGLVLTPLLPGGPSSKMITRDTYRLDVSQRACMLRDFYRANRIYEWDLKKKK